MKALCAHSRANATLNAASYGGSRAGASALKVTGSFWGCRRNLVSNAMGLQGDPEEEPQCHHRSI